MSASPGDSLSITHLTAPARFGGAESVVRTLALLAARRGHRVRIVAIHGLDPSDRCALYHDIPEVECIEIRLPPRSYWQEVRLLAEVLGREPGTVAHSHGYHADLVGYLAARRSARPIVSTVHGYTSGDLKNRIYEWLDRRALRRCDAVVAVSRSLRDRLLVEGIPPARIHLVPNGWAGSSPLDREEARRALGLPDDRPVVGWVGRLTAEKGPDLFVQAASRLPKEIGLSVVGDGRLREALVAQADRSGLGRRVVWHGAVEDAGRYLAAFDVLVMSSRTEGMPIVLLEAMAARVPVVATSVGGIPEMVSAAEATLVPPEDPDALAAGVVEALRGTTALARVDAAWRRLHDEFGPEQWIERHEAIYRSVACRS